MPIYEYRCSRCGESFEKMRRVADADRELQCPKCDSEEIERLLSAFSTSASSGCAPRGRFT